MDEADGKGLRVVRLLVLEGPRGSIPPHPLILQPGPEQLIGHLLKSTLQVSSRLRIGSQASPQSCAPSATLSCLPKCKGESLI